MADDELPDNVVALKQPPKPDPEDDSPDRKEILFYVGKEDYVAEVMDPETWTPQDWSNLILAALRTAQRHSGDDMALVLSELNTLLPQNLRR